MKLSTVPEYAKNFFSKTPSFTILYVTSRCNMKCEFCFYSDSLNQPWRDGMTLEEITKVAKSLYPCIHFTLTGGESFLRPDLVEVMQALIDHAGARNITIATNGSYTERMVAVVEKTVKDNPAVELRICLSIDALGEKHDQVRGTKGAFAKALASVAEMKRLQKIYPNLHLMLATVASKYNKDYLKDFFDYAATNLITDDHALILARGDTRKKDAKDITPSEYKELVAYMEERMEAEKKPAPAHSKLLGFIEKEIRHIAKQTNEQKQFQNPCVAAGKFIVIYETGDVYPCEIIETLNIPDEFKEKFGGNFKLGNVRDFDFDVKRLLKTERAYAMRKFIADSKCHCTFECAIAASVVFNPKTLLKTIVSPPSLTRP